MEFKHKSGYSLAQIILPGRTGNDVVEAISKAGGRNIISLGARGTILSDDNSWLARKFPPPSPQQDVFQVLVPNCKLNSFITEIIKVGGLHVSGAGAIFTTPCEDAHCSENFHFWDEKDCEVAELPESSKKMIGINCIVERKYAEPITQAALLAGSPGPTVTFAEGRGLRDKIRLLRIAKTAEKEIVQVVVEDVDADLVFSEMSRAGKITEPGRGFIYTFPVSSALINSTSTESDRKHSASMQEIITAIDEMKGDKSWRGYDPLARAATKGKSFANEKFLNGLVNLTCIANRDSADLIMDAIFKAGAPAASVAYGKVLDPISEKEGDKKSLNVEWGVIQAIISPGLVDKVRESIMSTCESEKIEEVCIYTFQVPKAQTFLG